MRRIIVAGSENFKDFTLLEEKLRPLINQRQPIEMITNGTKNMTSLCEKYTEKYGHTFSVIPIDWDSHERDALQIRNEYLVSHGHDCLVFLDNESVEIKNLVNAAKTSAILLRVVTEYEQKKHLLS